MSESWKKLLDHPDKMAEHAKDEIARLWRIILGDLKVKELEFERLLIAWFDDPANGIPKIGRVLASERGNLIKAFENDNMTWKVFLKGIRFLRPKSMSIRITLDWGNRGGGRHVQTVHELHVPVSQMSTGDSD